MESPWAGGRCNRVHQIVLLQHGRAKVSFYKYSEAERKVRLIGSCPCHRRCNMRWCQAIADDFNEGSMKVFDTIFNSQVGQRLVCLAAFGTCRCKQTSTKASIHCAVRCAALHARRCAALHRQNALEARHDVQWVTIGCGRAALWPRSSHALARGL